jgi:predicted ArsR family transcriptional regulator
MDEDDEKQSADPEDFQSRVTSIAALAEPVRRDLYLFVSSQTEPVGREQAAAGVGVPLHVAKFHLDKLVDDGLLEYDFRRLTGRRGPGAGRPSKVYRRSDREVAVSLPERHYELAGRLLAEAVTRSVLDGTSVTHDLQSAAQSTGEAIGVGVLDRVGPGADPISLQEAVIAELEGQGYEPRSEPQSIVLANCPFHSLAVDYTDLVCGMNLDLMRGLLAQLDAAQLRAVLDPMEGQCCVRLLKDDRPSDLGASAESLKS